MGTFPGQSPFAPVSYREPAPARVPDHPPMMRRLIDLGITQDEREEVREAWAAMTDEEKARTIEAYENIDDDELRAAIEEDRRAEPDDAPLQEAVVAVDEVRSGAAELVSAADADAEAIDPEDVPDDSVPAVLEWVGGDRARAAAALIAEQRRHDPPRKTLVEPLSPLVG